MTFIIQMDDPLESVYEGYLKSEYAGIVIWTDKPNAAKIFKSKTIAENYAFVHKLYKVKIIHVTGSGNTKTNDAYDKAMKGI